MNLKDLIDKEIQIWIPFFSREEFLTATLRGVESGGIWVEGEAITRAVLSEGVWEGQGNPVGLSIAPAVFFPYHEIRFALAFVSGMTLNEKSLGL